MGGLRALELVVSRNTDEETRLPPHLPLQPVAAGVQDSEIMRERVHFAMGETEGFGAR